MNITAAPYTATSSGYGYPSISDSPASPSRNRQPPLEDLAARTAPAATTDPAAPDRTASDPRNAGQTSENREAGSAQNQESRDQQAAAGNDTTRVNGRELSQEEVRLLEQLKQIDAEVKRHEMAHVSAGGQYIRSGANFTYK